MTRCMEVAIQSHKRKKVKLFSKQTCNIRRVLLIFAGVSKRHRRYHFTGRKRLSDCELVSTGAHYPKHATFFILSLRIENPRASKDFRR